MTVPKVFVSYSHDSQDHKKWVLDLATRLRNNGIDAVLDQWELRPGDDLPHFMESHLASSDFVVMVCTQRYVEKANAGTGGVGYEKMIVTADLLSSIDSNKVIPITKQESSHNVPTFLKSKLFIDFSRADDFEFSFDELLRTLHGTPIFEKPEVGNNPFEHPNEARPEKKFDGLKEVMKVIVADFESGSDFTNYNNLFNKVGISRIMLDVILNEAQDKSLIYRYEDGDIQLQAEGKSYALEHNLV